MLDAYNYLFCSKLCRHNWRKPKSDQARLIWHGNMEPNIIHLSFKSSIKYRSYVAKNVLTFLITFVSLYNDVGAT